MNSTQDIWVDTLFVPHGAPAVRTAAAPRRAMRRRGPLAGPRHGAGAWTLAAALVVLPAVVWTTAWLVQHAAALA